MIERVETWLEHPVLGTCPSRRNYPSTAISAAEGAGEDRAEARGLQTFDATTHECDGESRKHRRIAAAAAGGRPGRRAGRRDDRADAGVSRRRRRPWRRKSSPTASMLTAAYVALAVGSPVTSSCSEADRTKRAALAVIARRNERLFPNKPIRYVVKHASALRSSGGLAPFAAEGITSSRTTTTGPPGRRGWGAPRTPWAMPREANRKPKVDPPRTSASSRRHTHHRTAPREGPRAQRRHADRVPAQGKDPGHG